MSDIASINGFKVGLLPGVPEEHAKIVRELVKIWKAKYPRNLLRSRYYGAKNRLKDFGIGVPDKISSQAQAMIGWPELAVRSLSDLSSFQGFNTGSDDPLDVHSIYEENELDQVVAETIVSAYTHGCAFLTVTLNEAGVPVIRPASAEWSAGIWDYATHKLSAALTIMQTDKNGRITRFAVWLAGVTYDCSRNGTTWNVVPLLTGLNEPAVVAFVHDKHLQRPFGYSRISRPVMACADIGFRSFVRMEANAEFYSTPRLWFLGLNKDAFDTGTWSAVLSAANSISRDMNGDIPQLEQIEQASMTPHIEMLKSLAMLCASITRVPVDYFGITLDNPSSAEAMASAERRLTRIADRQNIAFSRALKKALALAVRIRDGKHPEAELFSRVTPIWAPTREISDAARADSFTKVASVVPGYADSDVGLERLGLSQEEITRLRVGQQKTRAQALLDSLTQVSDRTEDEPGEGVLVEEK